MEVYEFPFAIPATPRWSLPARLWKAARQAPKCDLWHSFHYLDDYTEPLIARLAGAGAWVYTKKNMSWNRRSWRLRTRLASRVLAQNTDMMSRFFARADRVKFVPRGVDGARFHPSLRRERESGAFRVGVAAHLVAVKGHPTLLEAVARLPDVRLEIAGKPLDQDYSAGLRVRSEQPDLAGRVTFHGGVEDVPRFLGGLDAFVLPTWGRWRQEGCPVALLEAMASGLACVATDIAGSRDLIVHNESGLVVPPENSDSLAAALAALRDHSELRSRLGRAARRRIEENYTIEREVADHESVYRELSRSWRS